MTIITTTEGFSIASSNLSKERIFKHTCQLLVKEGLYKFSPWGSGVLVYINNDYCIFTAAHVTEKVDELNLLYILTFKGIIPIVGELRETDLTHDKNIDVAFIRLEKGLAETLKQSYEFLPQNKIELNHKAEDTTQYLTLGFPEKNIKIDKECHIIKTGSTTLLHKLMKDKVYEKYKLDKSLHLIVDYAGKGYDMVTGVKKTIIRKPHGMSGCGLWYISINSTGDDYSLDYSLIAIMTEYREKPFDSLIGVKVDVIIDGIMNL